MFNAIGDHLTRTTIDTILNSQPHEYQGSYLQRNLFLSSLGGLTSSDYTLARHRVSSQSIPNPSELQAFIKNIVNHRHKADSPDSLRRNYHVPSLEMSAADSAAKAIFSAKTARPEESISQLEAFYQQFPQGISGKNLRKRVEEALYNQAATVSKKTQGELAREIAFERVRQGESCQTAAAEQGFIWCSDTMSLLQMIAVTGPAGERVRQGECYRTVANEHGICRPGEAWDELQLIAIRGPAGERVAQGVSCRAVAEAFGIDRSGKAWNALQMVAVTGPAGDEVRQGASCQTVADKYGITRSGKIWDALQMVVVNGPGGERVRQGEPCEKVAADFGIIRLGEAWDALQRIARKSHGHTSFSS